MKPATNNKPPHIKSRVIYAVTFSLSILLATRHI